MVLAQIIRGSHKIADIRREVRIGKLALAAANAGEIETQHSDVASCKALGHPRSCEYVLAAGEAYPSGEGRLSSVGLMWRDCAVVQTPVFAPVQETERWQASRYWLVLGGGARGGADR